MLGRFCFADTLQSGNYRVRAYTQWMRNLGETDFFDRNIAIGALQNEHVPGRPASALLQVVNNRADVQFFPEGGRLVAGVRTKIAFKAIGLNGLGLDVKGIILNETKKVDTFASTHLGMGYFYLTATEGESFKAKVTFADGTQNIVDLPKPEASGTSLTVDNNSIAKASITIESNAAYYKANQNKNFLLVIYSGGKLITVPYKLEDPISYLDVDKKLLQTGVARATLFSSEGEPICERLLFIQHYDQLNLSIHADKTAYTKREKVSLLLNEKNQFDSTISGHFSVSVIDESKVPKDENNERTILTDLLLTSDLKGYVEQPNYYFKDTSENARTNLDVLMLTQGYRRFEWKQVLDTNYTHLAYPPEKGLEIRGRVTKANGEPIADGTVTLVPSKGGPLLSTLSDKKGIFHFSNLIFPDTTHFVLSAVNSKGRNSTKLTFYTGKDEPVVCDSQQRGLQISKSTNMSAYLENSKNERNEQIKYGGGKGTVLKEVTVRAYKTDDQYRTQSFAGAGHADQVIHSGELEKVGGLLSTGLEGRLHGVGFSKVKGAPYLRGLGNGPMLVIIDGVEMNMPDKDGHMTPYDINTIPSSQVETVELLKYASSSIYGMTGGNGVLIITTKQGGERKSGNREVASNGVLPIAPTGFYKAREFYSPKYNYTNANSKSSDLRSTIYWNPEVKTDKEGNASFDYYNADGTGTYRVVIEGIDNNGNLGRLVYRYKVQ